jgi:hypothetical protein
MRLALLDPLFTLRSAVPTVLRLRNRPARAIAAWLVPPVTVAAVLSLVLYTNARDQEHARALAATELEARLDGGERVWREVYAVQRHWYDLYRATYGVLAATDRRVIFVGVVPELYPAPDAPRVFDVRSFSYDTTFRMAATHVPPAVHGVFVASGDSAQRFGVARAQREVLHELVLLATQRSFALANAARRERQYRDSLAALPPIREYHDVQRGEALETIARRYGTTADRLRTLNGLTGDRIVVGQALVVRETPRPIPPCPVAICGDVAASAGEIQIGPAHTPSPRPR